jgi:hypothetical protein
MLHVPRLLSSLVAVLGVLAPAPPVSAKKPKPTACPGGRYVVEGDRLIGSGAVPADALVLAAGSVSVDSGCGPVKAKVRAKRRFTLVNARWRSCSGLAGKAALKARNDAATCASASGVFKAKKDKIRRRFGAAVQGPPAFTTGAFTDVALSGATIAQEGGTVAVHYPQPDPADWNVPDPPGVMLP